MRRRLLGLFLMLLAFLVLTGAQRPAPMYMQTPISVPAGTSLEEVIGIVKEALVTRGWTVDQEVAAEDGEATEVTTTLHIRIHSVTIKIAIDTKQIHMTYVSSTEMRYKESKKKGPMIHPNYGRWLRNLELDINTAVKLTLD